MIVINLVGLALIIFIVWWFWLYQPLTEASIEDEILITVENGVYQPSHIKIPADQTYTLKFLRKDPTPCASSVIFSNIEVNADLPVDSIVRVDLPALKKGSYEFACQMRMYKGLLIAE